MKDSFAIDDNNYILCTSRCQTSTISFSQPTTFPKECQKDENLTDIYDYASACNVEYVINYQTELIHVTFQATNDTTVFEGQKPSEYFIQEIDISLNQRSYKPNIVKRKYGCNTKSDCAREFYLGTIEYLVAEVDHVLNGIKRKLQDDTLIYGRKSRRQCTNSSLVGDKTWQKCKNGLCYAHNENFTMNIEQSNKQQTCDLTREPFLYSYIEYHGPKSIEKDKELLQYRCNKNVCNRDTMISKIQNIINSLTNWNSTVPEFKESISTKASSSMKLTIATYIVVLFFILTQLLV